MKNGNEVVYWFFRSYEDQEMSIFGRTDLRLTLEELPKDTPALVLLRLEERNWFTQMSKQNRKYKFHV